MRVDELRVGDEDEPVGVCTSLLHVAVNIAHSFSTMCAASYPVLPLVPMAALYSAVEHASLTPVQDKPPHYDQRIRKCEELPDTPVRVAQGVSSLLHCRSYPVQEECPRKPPCLVG